MSSIRIGDLGADEVLDGSEMSQVQGGIIIVCSPTASRLSSTRVSATSYAGLTPEPTIYPDPDQLIGIAPIPSP